MSSRSRSTTLSLRDHRGRRIALETTAQGCRRATSVGGVLTGRGADLVIIGDPLKPEEALSQTQRRAANEWFDHTLYSRPNDKQQGAIILIIASPAQEPALGQDPRDDLVAPVLVWPQ